MWVILLLSLSRLPEDSHWSPVIVWFTLYLLCKSHLAGIYIKNDAVGGPRSVLKKHFLITFGDEKKWKFWRWKHDRKVLKSTLFVSLSSIFCYIMQHCIVLQFRVIWNFIYFHCEIMKSISMLFSLVCGQYNVSKRNII